MKKLFIIFSIIALISCKKKETPAPNSDIKTIMSINKDTSFLIKVTGGTYNYSYTATHGKYAISPVGLRPGQSWTATITTGDTIAKTIIMVLGKDTLKNQTSTSDPFTVSIIAP